MTPAIKILHCEKCGFQFQSRGDPAEMTCGAAMGFFPIQGGASPDETSRAGCGGNIIEITQEEAFENVRNQLD